MASAPQVSTQHARVLRIALAGTLSPFFSEALKRHAVSLVELDESASVDAVILLPGSNADNVYARMAHGGNLLAAVIDLSGLQSPRADFVAATAGPDSLARGIETAMSLREKCAALAAIPDNADRIGLTALALSITRECDIAPRLNPDRPSMFDYPLLAGIADQRSTLETLAAAKLLKRDFSDRIYLCEDCNGSRLLARDVLLAFAIFSTVHEILYQRIFWFILGACLAASHAQRITKTASPPASQS